MTDSAGSKSADDRCMGTSFPLPTPEIGGKWISGGSALGCQTYRFLVACVRSLFDNSAGICGTDPATVAWDFLLALARENRVDVLLLHGLQSLGIQGVPREVLASLAAYERQNRARNDATIEMLVRILGELAARAIPSLVFKGPTVARAYADPGMRFYWDLDLLVPRNQLPGVHEALLSLGYKRDALSPREERLYMRYHFAHTYTSTAAGPDIDVHWRLFPASFPIPFDYAALWSRSEPIEIGGFRAQTFSREDLFVYLALHGAKEEWRRLQMVSDVAAMLSAAADIDWERCLRIADECRARRKFLLALSLASELLGATVPNQLAPAMSSDPIVPMLADEVMRRQQRLTERATSIFRLSRWRMLSFEHPIDRARYCWRTISAPRIEHLAIVDLPMLPLTAYVPIRLVHDYVAIPLRDWARRSARKLGSKPR